METLEETFKSLAIARRLQPSEATYILDAAAQPGGGPLVAVSCSNRALRLHQCETLALQGEFKGHTGTLCGVRFGHASPDTLYSGSADGTLRCWDARRPGSEATRVFRSEPGHAFCSMDISSNDVVLCAGTEQVGEDSFLVFWDARMATGASGKQQGLLGVYSESHSDDITTVRFHPRQADRLASGGTDGLVNVFELNLGGEEDALVTTCNCDSSAGSICWAGRIHRMAHTHTHSMASTNTRTHTKHGTHTHTGCPTQSIAYTYTSTSTHTYTNTHTQTIAFFIPNPHM